MANMTDKNVTTVRKEDKTFIRSLMSLSQEKKVLIQGIIIGLELQEKQSTTVARQAVNALSYSRKEERKGHSDITIKL